MMLKIYSSILILAGILFVLFYFGNKKFKNNFLKGISLFLAFIFVMRCGLGREAISQIRGLNINNNLFFGESQLGFTALTTIIIWFTYPVIYLLLLFPFFDIKVSKNTLKFFLPIMLLLDLIFLKQYLIGIMGLEIFNGFNASFFKTIAKDPRLIFLVFEFAIMIAYYLVIFINKDFFKVTLKDLGKVLIALACMLIISMPVFVPKVLFGYKMSNVEFVDLNKYHRMLLYFALIVPYLVYRVLKKRSFEEKHYTLLFIALASMFSYCYNFKFDVLTDMTRWPLHLCNTAMFVVPLCLIFIKTNKLFYFTVFINVFGAFVALLMPSYTWYNVFEINTVEFYLNHILAYCMPALAIFLGLYERPKMKTFGYSMIAFLGYFILVLTIDAYFYDEGVDFFFLNSDFIVNKLGAWAERFRDISWSFKLGSRTLTFYPVYQTAFFITYVGLAFAMWFLYEQMFAFQDLGIEIEKKKEHKKMQHLVLISALQGRGVDEPMNLEGTNCFELKHFSKRYGLNKKFAVDDVSLKVNGGEIFGFLGPNGAGKSTIIKSLVGIQSITKGNIEVCGYDIEKQNVMAKSQIGFVPDHYALYENLTGREYINYVADIYHVTKEDRDERISYYVNLFQLEESFDNPMKTYSHGMKQKMTIIAALIHEPKVWILDEPLTGLDPTSIFQVKECMKNHAAKGNVVFFSSHIIDVVEKLCTRIAIIKKGHILVDAKVSDLKEQNIDLEQFYLEHIGERDIVKE